MSHTDRILRATQTILFCGGCIVLPWTVYYALQPSPRSLAGLLVLLVFFLGFLVAEDLKNSED